MFDQLLNSVSQGAKIISYSIFYKVSSSQPGIAIIAARFGNSTAGMEMTLEITTVMDVWRWAKKVGARTRNIREAIHILTGNTRVVVARKIKWSKIEFHITRLLTA